MNRRNSYFASKLSTRNEATENQNLKIIEGYFAKFNDVTEITSDMKEMILKNAFKNSLLNNDIRCLFNHNTDVVLGRNTSGTLTLYEDDIGLFGRLEINSNDVEACNIYERVKRGDITGCSFGFYPIEEELKWEDEIAIFQLKEVDLLEVSICTFPAYPTTEINARTDSVKNTIEKKKKILKERLNNVKNS